MLSSFFIHNIDRCRLIIRSSYSSEFITRHDWYSSLHFMINHKYRSLPAQMTFRKMRPLQTSTTDQSESSNCQDNVMLISGLVNVNNNVDD